MSGHRKTLAIRKAQMLAFLDSVRDSGMDPERCGLDLDNPLCGNTDNGMGKDVELNTEGETARARARNKALYGSERWHGPGAMPEVDPDRVWRRGLRLEHERQYANGKYWAGKARQCCGETAQE